MIQRLNVFGIYKGLPKEIYVLFMARVITAFGTFVVPFLSLFMTARLGMSEKMAGFYITLTSISYIPGSLIGGKLSDRYSKKHVYIIAQALSALCILGVVFSEISLLKIVLIILSSVFVAASYPAIDALVAEYTVDAQRKSAYSLMYLGLNLGYSLGSVAAGFLFYQHTDLLFIGDAATTFLSLVILLVMVKGSLLLKDDKIIHENITYRQDETIYKVLFKMPLVLAFSIISTFYAFAYSQYNFSLPLHLNNLFSESGSYYYGLLMAANGLCVIILAPLILNLTKKALPVLNMVLSGIFYGIGFGLYYLASNLSLCLIATLVWTIGEILYSTNFTVYIVSKTPKEYRGRLISISTIISHLGLFLGPVIMGGVIPKWGTKNIWPAIFIIMVISTLAMLHLHVKEAWKQTFKSKDSEEGI